MILILRTTKLILGIGLLLMLCLPWAVRAQEALTLSVSPTLFEMTANLEQDWSSSIRVINGNSYDITVYLDVVNFAPQGESGQVKFLPLLEKESEGKTLAEWISTETEEITIPAEQALDIPFSISVPSEAQPGGHFAAILVGTKSLNTGENKSLVETSQVVTSLLFLRVTGNVIEDGLVREFKSVKSIVEKPEMEFELRFENKGNVQILPQGEIRIFNMWGQERGIIPVNRKTMFGNVLPEQIRKYSFKWSGEWSLADMGRYRAVATLAYGEDARQFASSETTFWVIPWKMSLLVLVIILSVIALVSWSIKIYIRKMLSMAGVSPDAQVTRDYPVRKKVKRKVSVVAPIEEGILDLRNSFRTSETWSAKLASLINFVRHYKLFFFVAGVMVVFVWLVVGYVRSASVSERPYEVVVKGVEQDVVISSEQVKYETLRDEVSTKETVVQKEFPAIRIINQSGVNGLAAKLRVELEVSGYEITELTSDLENQKKNTVIVYSPEYATEALELSSLIGGALLSSYTEASADKASMTVYVGKDFENAL